MKNLLTLLLLVTFAGCGLELLGSAAIQSELQAEQLKAATGQVNRAADATAKINIQRAIDTYYAEVGQYPARLEDLVPNYLPSLPPGPNGTPYAYDPTQGKLIDSAAPAQAPVAGAGLAGEAATGIAIQNQLNSMNQSGPASAQTRMRQNVGDVNQQYNQQQEQALKELGM